VAGAKLLTSLTLSLFDFQSSIPSVQPLYPIHRAHVHPAAVMRVSTLLPLAVLLVVAFFASGCSAVSKVQVPPVPFSGTATRAVIETCSG
jgi:hypothetical protein